MLIYIVAGFCGFFLLFSVSLFFLYRFVSRSNKSDKTNTSIESNNISDISVRSLHKKIDNLKGNHFIDRCKELEYKHPLYEEHEKVLQYAYKDITRILQKISREITNKVNGSALEYFGKNINYFCKFGDDDIKLAVAMYYSATYYGKNINEFINSDEFRNKKKVHKELIIDVVNQLFDYRKSVIEIFNIIHKAITQEGYKYSKDAYTYYIGSRLNKLNCLGYVSVYLSVAEVLNLPIYASLEPNHIFIRWKVPFNSIFNFILDWEATVGQESKPKGEFDFFDTHTSNYMNYSNISIYGIFFNNRAVFSINNFTKYEDEYRDRLLIKCAMDDVIDALSIFPNSEMCFRNVTVLVEKVFRYADFCIKNKKPLTFNKYQQIVGKIKCNKEIYSNYTLYLKGINKIEYLKYIDNIANLPKSVLEKNMETTSMHF